MATFVLQAITGAHTLTCLLCRNRSRRNRDAPNLPPQRTQIVRRGPRLGSEPGQLARAATSILRSFSIQPEPRLLLLQVDGLVLVAVDGVANLGRGLAEPGHPIGKETLFGAVGALGGVRGLIATA